MDRRMNLIRRTTEVSVLCVLALALAGPFCGTFSGSWVVSGMANAWCGSVPDSLVNDTSESTLALKGGIGGNILGDLTIEGEDRINIRFERPGIKLDMAMRKAPGLSWKDSWEKMDMFMALTRDTAFRRPGCVARPWLGCFSRDNVAVFRPEKGKSESWSMTIVDSRGREVRTFSGRGDIPREIVWDGRTDAGDPATAGLTYSSIMESTDRAGNERTYVGSGFDLLPFMLSDSDYLRLIFSGADAGLGPDATDRTGRGRLLLVEAASWLNQAGDAGSPVIVSALARTVSQAESLARGVAGMVGEYLAGDSGRISCEIRVAEDAPDNGAVEISVNRVKIHHNQ